MFRKEAWDYKGIIEVIYETAYMNVNNFSIDELADSIIRERVKRKNGQYSIFEETI